MFASRKTNFNLILVYEETKSICQIYANLKGAGTQAVPERHAFFKNLGAIISRNAEKCERENGMIYHQKLPIETPILDPKAIHGYSSKFSKTI